MCLSLGAPSALPQPPVEPHPMNLPLLRFARPLRLCYNRSLLGSFLLGHSAHNYE